MASALTATVVSLDSRPASAAAQRRARLRSEAMRRHPAFQSRQGGAALGKDVSAVIYDLSVRRGGKLAVDAGPDPGELTKRIPAVAEVN